MLSKYLRYFNNLPTKPGECCYLAYNFGQIGVQRSTCPAVDVPCGVR